jgi:hypothetical protein
LFGIFRQGTLMGSGQYHPCRYDCKTRTADRKLRLIPWFDKHRFFLHRTLMVSRVVRLLTDTVNFATANIAFVHIPFIHVAFVHIALVQTALANVALARAARPF